MSHRRVLTPDVGPVAAGVWETLNATAKQQAVEILVKLALKHVAQEAAADARKEISCLTATAKLPPSNSSA